MEGINSLVQAAKAWARGYRNVVNFITIIYLIAGKLDLRFAHTKWRRGSGRSVLVRRTRRFTWIDPESTTTFETPIPFSSRSSQKPSRPAS